MIAVFALIACRSPDVSRHHGEGPPAVIPLPSLMETRSGTFTLGSGARVVGSGEAAAVAEQLASELRPATGFALPVAQDGALPGDIALRLDPGIAPGGYTLDVDAAAVAIAASDGDGWYWGGQTLRQLFPAEILASTASDGPWTAPAVHVEDAPTFAWRGAMIDVARHFFTVAEIERQVDAMALLKLDRLHLHLTDDQGWRIEITSWPDLTAIGGSTGIDGQGGFYTQEDYAAITAYAAARHVVVVPEIDLPGHANAALASYPELNESGVTTELSTSPVSSGVALWVDGPATAGFVADVWGEVDAMTPGPSVHVGGDEVSELSDAEYASFMQAVAGDVAADGKVPTGWDEVATAGLSTPFTAQYWFDPDNAVLAAEEGAQVIASPADHCYLDMIYDSDAAFGQVWAGAVDERAAYDWDPTDDVSAVIGLEGALWTELIDTPDKMDFMLWPRLAALAEVGWTPETSRDWDDFAGRLADDGPRLDALGLAFYPTPEIDW